MGFSNKKGEAEEPRRKSGRGRLIPRNVALVGRRLLLRHHVDAVAVLVEQHAPVGQREEGPIPACADIPARDEFRAALADKNAAGGDGLTAVDLAVSIYLDGLNIFIALLELFGMRSRDD